MRAFNSSYVCYVRSLIQSPEKELTSALRRAPLSVLPGPRFFAGIFARQEFYADDNCIIFDEVGAFVIRPPIGQPRN